MADDTVLHLNSAGRRAAAYWFIDGLPDLAFGLAYLAVGTAGVIRGFDWGNRGLKWSLAITWLVFVLMFLRDRKVLDFFKARLTYPRTGYVRPPAEPWGESAVQRLIVAKAPADENVSSFRVRTVLVFYVAMQLVWTFEGASWTVPIFMALVALVVYAWNLSDARPYSWWAVLPIAFAGLVSASIDLPAKSRRFLPLVIGGLWLLAQGGWTLARYLRAHPRRRVLEGAQS